MICYLEIEKFNKENTEFPPAVNNNDKIHQKSTTQKPFASRAKTTLCNLTMKTLK